MINCWKSTQLLNSSAQREEDSVGYPSVSLSPTLNKNEKVKQYIRKKTNKPTALRF